MAIKQWLKNGGIAVALTVGAIEGTDRLIETPVEREVKFATAVNVTDSARFKKIVGEEVRIRRVGEEIKSLRKPHSQTFKDDGKYRMVVHSEQICYPDGDSLMPVNTMVREVEPPNLLERAVGAVKGALGMETPEPTHDRYVYAGPYAATWFASKDYDYTLSTPDGSESIAYTALHDMRSITPQTEPTPEGIKQTLILSARPAKGQLRWKVTSTSPLVHRGNGVVTAGSLTISAPVAWDAKGDTVQVAVSVSGDTLTYAVFDTGKTYPIWVDPSTTVSGNVANGYITKFNTTYTAVPGNTMIIGSVGSWSNYSTVYRAFGCFPGIPELAQIDSANYVLRPTEILHDPGYTDWWVLLGDCRVYKSELGSDATDAYNDFARSIIPHYMRNYAAENLSKFTVGSTYRIAFSDAGLDTLEAIGARGDSLWLKLRGTGEIDASYAFHYERLTFDGGNSSTAPYLEIFYTTYLNTPTDFVLSDATPTTALVTYDPNCSANIDSATVVTSAGAWMARFSPNNATTLTLAGLTPDTEYIAKAKIDSAGEFAYSNLDTIRTLAATPIWNFSEDYTDSTQIRIGIGTNGNPAGTVYAIRDSVNQKWISSAGLSDSTHKVWQTAANWATTEYITSVDPSLRHYLGVVARNADGVETAYDWGSISVGNVRRVVINASTAVMTQSVSAISYGVARSDTSESVVTYSLLSLAVGQTAATGVWGIFRLHFEFPIISYIDSVLADSLQVTGHSDVSTEDFRIYGRPSTWNIWNPYVSWHYLFAGAKIDSTSLHVGQNLFQDWSSSSYASTMKWAFSDTGNVYVNSKIGSTLKLTVTSDADSLHTSPTGSNAQDIIITSPQLILSYIWMDKAPSSITATAVAADSVHITFNDRSYSEDGYALIDALTDLRVGGADSVAADSTTIRLGGLLPNTVYRFKIQVLGGKMAGEISTVADSCRTWAATPPSPTVTVLSALTHRKIVIDTTGLSNPGTTLYALQDSITGKYVRPYAGALDSMVSGTYDSSWVWQTFSQWGGANGDTIYFPAGNRSAFRIYSKNSQ